jgi:hypothetical protein
MKSASSVGRSPQVAPWRHSSLAASAMALVMALGAASARAAEPAKDPVPGGWTFELTPYVWFASLDGDVRTRERFPVVHVDESFSDIVDNLDMAFMLMGEARKDRFGLVFDLDYLDLSDTAQTPGALFGNVKGTSKMLLGTLAGAYRVVEEPQAFVDVLGGARLWSIDNKLEFSAGLLPSVSTSQDKTWVDPIVGLRGGMDLGHDFSLSAYADIGGFGVGSHFSWQALATVNYDFNDSIAARLGWRYLSVDYDEDGFLWDVDLSGPILGVAFKF